MAESARYREELLSTGCWNETRHVEDKATAISSPIILVVTCDGHISLPVMDYTVNFAQRLRYKLLAAYVNTLPHFWDGGKKQNSILSAMLENTAIYKEKATLKGVSFNYVRESGKLGKVINRLCHIVKRIDFVVIDKGVKNEKAVSRVPVPVFNVHFSNALQSAQEPNSSNNMFLTRISPK